MRDSVIRHEPLQEAASRWPAWFRLVVIALATCVLSACHSALLPSHRDAGSRPAQRPHTGPGGQDDVLVVAPGGAETVSRGVAWRPPGISGPWPRDEYLHDGGDHGSPAAVLKDRTVRGLEPEDTVVHYDTIDGRTGIQPSNRVNLYAPRFAAVRRVQTAAAAASRDQMLLAQMPRGVRRYDTSERATTALQRRGLKGRRVVQSDSVLQRRQKGGELEGPQRMAVAESAALPQSDTVVDTPLRIDDRDQPFAVEVTDKLLVGTHVNQVQVILDGKSAVAMTSDKAAAAVFIVDEPDNAQVRLNKSASTTWASPGDQVDFAIRYENVGDQVVGNLVILDNLTSRLQYVEGTAQSSAKAAFRAEPNANGSSLLRWEIDKPLAPGGGGTVRFRCRIR